MLEKWRNIHLYTWSEVNKQSVSPPEFVSVKSYNPKPEQLETAHKERKPSNVHTQNKSRKSKKDFQAGLHYWQKRSPKAAIKQKAHHLLVFFANGRIFFCNSRGKNLKMMWKDLEWGSRDASGWDSNWKHCYNTCIYIPGPHKYTILGSSMSRGVGWTTRWGWIKTENMMVQTVVWYQKAHSYSWVVHKSFTHKQKHSNKCVMLMPVDLGWATSKILSGYTHTHTLPSKLCSKCDTINFLPTILIQLLRDHFQAKYHFAAMVFLRG